MIEDKLVNEARNQGVAKAKGKYIFVLNDDIILYNDTIEKMIKALDTCTVAGPYFKRGIDDPRIYTSNWRNIVGFCFAFKRQDRDKLFPIDDRLKLWFGDNFIYHKANKNIGWWWFVYHRESKSLMSDEHRDRCLKIIEQDKDAWREIMEEKWWV